MGPILLLLKPIVSLIPKIQKPIKRITFNEKLMWTIVTLLIFLICSQIPIYGIKITNSNDPDDIMSVVMASHKGSLMELGISPIISASMILQFLQGAKIISVNMGDENEREVFEQAEKLFGLIYTIVNSVAYLYRGNFGDMDEIGTQGCILIIVQLFIAALIILLLDELLSSGYGFGSAISLLIATNVCENIIWKMFSPITYNHNGQQFEGAVINFFHLLLTRPDKFGALYDAFFRSELPNLIEVFSTIVVFLIVIYIQGFKVDIPLTSKQGRIDTLVYSIKLLYSSTMPIIFYEQARGMILVISRMLFSAFPKNFFVHLFGEWGLQDHSSLPISGLAYYLITPHSLKQLFGNPFHSVISIVIKLICCSFLSNQYVNISGSSSREVKKRIEEQRMSIKGFRDGESSIHLLDRYIPVAASLGGVCIALISTIADIFGAFGSGTGILLAASTINEVTSSLQKDWKRDKGITMNF